MSNVIYSGSMDSYFRHCADENARERELYRLQREDENARAGVVIVDTYRDVMGREQYRVTGPGGRFLVTRKDRHRSGGWEVWRSDSIRTEHRSTLDRAIAWAKRRAEYPPPGCDAR